MLPSILSRQIRECLEEYLKSTYPIDSPAFDAAFDELFGSEGALFKGPYLSIELPFRQEREHYLAFFGGKRLPHKPYSHQKEAFDRLRSERALSTLIATGTGSGKTECFFWPLLDHCYRERERRGIKAIIIYPMNALANDQARRLAQLVDGEPLLKNNVRAGLYIGDAGKASCRMMGPDRIINDRAALRANPPDILLTNYKMLDYLLVRPNDAPLWRMNGQETLKYLVVDELHTFDGAQGTDLACLIRRLKGRLGVEKGQLCCIGTSATLGGEAAPEKLCSYAQKIFKIPFSNESLIREKRESLEEFLERHMPASRQLQNPVPYRERGAALESLDPANYRRYDEYIEKLLLFWFDGERREGSLNGGDLGKLGSYLIRLPLFQNLMRLLEGKMEELPSTLEKICKRDGALALCSERERGLVLDSLLSLISAARNPANEKLPFLNVKLHYWMRELAKIVSPLSKKGSFAFAHDLKGGELKRHYPVVNCRDCGTTGWLASRGDEGEIEECDLEAIYEAFFEGKGHKLFYLFPLEGEEGDGEESGYLCSSCYAYSKEASCPKGCSSELLPIHLYRGKEEKEKAPSNGCPLCGSSKGLSIVGSRVASMASVIIGQLFSSPYNKDKKVLAFSDSVQDAAHRSSFFSARTYRFTMRAAIQQCLEEKVVSVSLESFHKLFMDHWRERLTNAQFVAKFIAPNMLEEEEFAKLKEREGKGLRSESRLYQSIAKRIEWEIFSEYGFLSTVGRTLPFTGSSTTEVARERVAEALDFLLPRLNNLQGSFLDWKREDIERFLQGLFMHLKGKGAIYHPVFDGYIRDGGNGYLLNRIDWMPGFGNKVPAFLTMEKGYSNFDSLLPKGGSSSSTWYQKWAKKVLGVDKEMVWRPFFELLTSALVAHSIFSRKETKKGSAVWGLVADALLIKKETASYRCNRCSHRVVATEEEGAIWEGGPCLRFQCKGLYARSDIAASYYRNWYREGGMERIFSCEHSSLVAEKEKEKIEKEFKASGEARKPWYTNLLSCTPTLEMGVDIGDLSSVILCSMPPSQASFIQRVGRSGRKNGNAFNIVIANARPHDLYFFTEPEEMFGGKIDPPDVYLKAQAVLERQLVAYCMDCWCAAGGAAMPQAMSEILKGLKNSEAAIFPHNFLGFIERNSDAIWKGFSALFSDDVEEKCSEGLRHFFLHSLSKRLKEELNTLSDQVQSLQKTIDSLTRKREQIKKQTVVTKEDEGVIREIEVERSGLLHLKKSLTNQYQPYNFLTDSGLLPNYAFPEAGVTLKSVILKDKKSDGECYPPAIEFTYQRPSSSAISEMAPNNSFYAQGRRVVIDQVDLFLSKIERWRFCDRCTFMQLEGEEPPVNNCPSCNSELWRDPGQVKQLIRLKSVIATSVDRNTRSEDREEERVKSYFSRKMHVNFKREAIAGGYKVQYDGKTFAFEFIKTAQFCEINYGEMGNDSSPMQIAGEKKPRRGFQICSKCGKVQNGKEIRHSHNCSAKSKKEPEQLLTDSIWLYREFESECIRLLIPPYYSVDLEGGEPSFIAAFHLGMKRKFGGSINHLLVTYCEEPLQSGFTAKYLVLYDSVPGGTGYLKELSASPLSLIEMLQSALTALSTCACNSDTAKDGCYSCLYTYRFSREIESLSRNLAHNMLDDIIKNSENFQEITHINPHDFIGECEQSALEKLFLERLSSYKRSGKSYSAKKMAVKGKPGLQIRVENNLWQLESDVSENFPDSPSGRIQIDFVLTPLEIDGCKASSDEKALAIFVDGFAFHKEQIDIDLFKRRTLAEAGKYRVWSLTWSDIEKESGNLPFNALDPRCSPSGHLYERWLDKKLGKSHRLFRNSYLLNSFELLLLYLEQPNRKVSEEWSRLADIHSLLFFDKNFCGDMAKEPIFAKLPQECRNHLEESVHRGIFTKISGSGKGSITIFYAAQEKGSFCSITCCLDDREIAAGEESREGKEVWNEYLRLYNLFQFLPEAHFITEMGIEKEGASLEEVQPKEKVEEGLENCTDENAKNFLIALGKIAGAPKPIVGYEWEEGGNGVAELSWPDAKICYIPPDDEENGKIFKRGGWRCLEVAEIQNHIEEVVTLITTGRSSP